jgi:hypothetical protein
VRLSLLLLVCFALGCSGGESRRSREHIPILTECFADAAYELHRSKRASSPDSDHTECCGKCGGTGKVKSGDGLAWVSCPCPDTCECKKAKQP